MKAAKFTDFQAALSFMLGGNSTFTVRSERTGTRFTFRVKEASTPDLYFVSLLTGSDNEDDYHYIGIIGTDGKFKLTKKSTMNLDSPPVKAFSWTYKMLTERRRVPDELSIWHDGRCGRCNRKLTVPESIESGFGPECIRTRKFFCQTA